MISTVGRLVGDFHQASIKRPQATTGTEVRSSWRVPCRRIRDSGAYLRQGDGCACRKLDPHMMVMQSAQDGAAEYATNGLGSAWDRRILVQG